MQTLRSLLPDARGLPRAYWWLFAATLVDRLGGFAHIYLALYLIGPGGLSPADAGLVASIQAVGSLVGTPVAGALADRLGRRPMLLAGFVLTGLAWLHVAFARGPVHLGLAVFLAGAASGLGRPAMAAAVADVVPEPDRRRAYALQYWAVNLGFAFAATMAGLLARVSPYLVFGLDALTSFCVAGVLARALPDLDAARVRGGDGPGAGTPGHGRPESLGAMLRGPLSDPPFLAVLFVGLANAALFMQCGVALATELRTDGLGEHYGPLIALNGVFIVLFQPLIVRLTARRNAVDVLAVGCAVMGVGFFSTAFCDTALAHAGAIALWTLGEILCASSTPVLVTRLAPVERRATYQGVLHTSWSAAAFAPALGAWVLETHGSMTLWSACLSIALAAAICVRPVRRRMP